MTTSSISSIPLTVREAAGGRRTLRRIGAVFAGLATNVIVTTAVDVALHATGVFPPLGQRMSGGLFLLALVYRTVFGVAGCYVTARLAPDRPMRHALALGVVGVIISSAGAIAMGDQGPAWYSLALIAVAVPCGWLGGRWRERELRSAKGGRGSR